MLREHKAEVKLFNATNLPDYDYNNTFGTFLEKLPWASQCSIVWNIHDRGPYFREYPADLDSYRHYLFMVSSPEEYKKFLKVSPLFFAEIDRITFARIINEFKSVEIDELMRFHPFFGNAEVVASARASYLAHLEKLFSQPISNYSAICNQYGVKYLPRDNASMEYLKMVEEEICKLYSQLLSNAGPSKSDALTACLFECLDTVRRADLSTKNLRAKFEVGVLLKKLKVSVNIDAKTASADDAKSPMNKTTVMTTGSATVAAGSFSVAQVLVALTPTNPTAVVVPLSQDDAAPPSVNADAKRLQVKPNASLSGSMFALKPLTDEDGVSEKLSSSCQVAPYSSLSG